MFKREFQLFLQNENKLKELLDGNKPFVKFGKEEFRISPFDISEPEGFKYSDNYPNCCEFHKTLQPYIENWFKEFPDCCNRHKEYKMLRWFNKDDYLNTPEKIRLQVSYTEFFIHKCINSNDWYKIITDYLEYNIRSFGSPEVGGDRYISIMEHYISNAKIEKSGISDFKRNRLLEFFEDSKIKEEDKKTDLNLIYSTFQKWVKVIPDIGTLKKVKKEVAEKFPLGLILYDGEYNPFLMETKFKCRTKYELIEILTEITKNSLLHISEDNLKNLDEKELSIKKKVIQIKKETHRLKQIQLLMDFENNEKKYIKTIKQWLKNEKLFFKEITNDLISPKTDSLENIKYSSKVKEIKHLISKNQLKDALNEIEHCCVGDSSLSQIEPDVIMLKGRLESINLNYSRGVVSNNDEILEKNRIRSSILKLVERIKETK